MKNRIRTILSTAIVLGSTAVWGQDAPEVKAKTWEVGTFLGSSFGLDSYRVMGGANVGYAITKVIFPYAEVSYLPGIARTEQVASDIKVSYKLPITDFHAGLHLRAPIPGSRFVPYGIIGAGMIRVGEGDGDRTQIINGVPDVRRVTYPGSNEFAVNFGGGARFYITERWGIRFEAKAYKPSGRFTDVFGRVAGGLFWQF